MYISESMFTVGSAGALEIPAVVLREMGLHAGDPVRVAYLTQDGQNTFREFLLSANPLDELTNEDQIKVPDRILEDANLPADADLQILCLNGCIVICQDSTLNSNELTAVLEQLRTADELTAALPDSPEQVCDQLEEFINHFQEGADPDDI